MSNTSYDNFILTLDSGNIGMINEMEQTLPVVTAPWKSTFEQPANNRVAMFPIESVYCASEGASCILYQNLPICEPTKLFQTSEMQTFLRLLFVPDNQKEFIIRHFTAFSQLNLYRCWGSDGTIILIKIKRQAGGKDEWETQRISKPKYKIISTN